MMPFKFFLILAFVTFRQSGGIVNIDPEKRQQIDDFINSILFDCEKHDVVGMSLAIVYRGDTLYTTGYGLKDLGEVCLCVKLPRVSPQKKLKSGYLVCGRQGMLALCA